MKYALIGCGRIAVNHIKAVANNNLELVAVCDIDPSKFDTMFEKAGFGDFPELSAAVTIPRCSTLTLRSSSLASRPRAASMRRSP